MIDIHVTDVRSGDKVSVRFVLSPGMQRVDLVRERDGDVLLSLTDVEAIGLAQAICMECQEEGP